MKRWSLFFLMSLLFHGILLLLFGLLVPEPSLKLQEASMTCRLVAHPGSAPQGEPDSGTAGEKTEEAPQDSQPAEKEPVSEAVPPVEEPTETEETVPAPPETSEPAPEEIVQPEPVPEEPPVSPEPAEELPKPEKPKKITPPKPKPKPEPKPKPQPKPKPKPEPVPEKKETPKSVPKQAPAAKPAPPAPSEGNEKVSPIPAGTPDAGEGKPAGEPGGQTGPVSEGPAIAEVQAGDILKKVAPRYPVVSRRRGEEGKVILVVTVKKGQVQEVRKEKSSGYERLDEAAMRAVKAWKFRGDLDGMFRIPVVFRLD